MEVKLKVLGGRHAGTEIPVVGQKFLIGRGPDCQLRAGSDLISRHHCQLTVAEGVVRLRDFNSRNGTLVNGEPIEGEVEINAGAQLEVGPLQFELLVEYPVGGKRRPPVKDMADAVARTAEPPRSGDVEESVSQWLEAPSSDSQVDALSAVETRNLKLENTDRIDAGQSGATPAPQAEPAAADEPASQEAKSSNSGVESKETQPGTSRPQKKPPGKLPKPAQPSAPKTESSQKAAADALRQWTTQKDP